MKNETYHEKLNWGFRFQVSSFRRPFFCFIIIFLWFIADIASISAQSMSPQIGVSPPMFELNVERGQTLEQKFKVYNPGEASLPIHIRPADFTADENSGQILFDSNEQDFSFASRLWFKIENPDFILESKEVETIKIAIKVPDNAEPGGHYSTLMLEPQLPSFYFEEGKPKVIPYVGILFLLSVNAEGLVRAEMPLTVVEFNIPEKFRLKRFENLAASVFAAEEPKIFSIVESGNLFFTLRIKNNDIYHIKPSGKLAITGAGQTEIKKMTILPGKTRQIPVEFKQELPEKIKKFLPAVISDFISRNLMWGKYTAFLELEGAPLESIEFWVFPWKSATVFLFFLVFLVLIRKRIILSIKTLIRR